MIHQLIKDLFASSVEHICSDISNYSIHPGIDFQRSQEDLSTKTDLFSRFTRFFLYQSGNA